MALEEWPIVFPTTLSTHNAAEHVEGVESKQILRNDIVVSLTINIFALNSLFRWFQTQSCGKSDLI